MAEGLVYPSDAVVGSAAVGESYSFSDAQQMQPPGGVFVGPGGETSPLNVPSAMDPKSSAQQVREPAVGSRTILTITADLPRCRYSLSLRRWL